MKDQERNERRISEAVAEMARLKAERKTQFKKIQNAAWIQSLKGWKRSDLSTAIVDASKGISYHVTRPTLEQIRNSK